VKLRAAITHASDPLIVGNGDSRNLCINLTFQDAADGDRICSTAVTWTPLIERLLQYRKRYNVYDILGEVYDFPVGEYGGVCEFRLIVYDVRPSVKPLQIVMATEAEIESARQLVQSFKDRKESIVEYIFRTATTERAIQGLDSAELLRDTLRFAIVQAASGGMVSGANGKLHSLVIGAPAVGKKLARDLIRAINPTFQEAHPSKVTAAGVSSTTYYGNGGWNSKPGYIPLAHQGAFVIQDYHAVETQKKKVQGVLSMTMEDGIIEDSTAARATHLAQTSIHLDLNKLSDLSPHILNPKLHRLDDIKIPMHLLSRFDFIVDIPRDTARQTDVALAMYSSLTSTRDLPDEHDLFRTLRVLIAYLRTAHSEVSFSAEVREYMKAKHSELVETNRLQFSRLPWLSDFQTRTTVSIAKFTAAAARLADRSEAQKEDVDLILPFVARKYEFLRSFQSHLVVPASWDGRRELRDRRTVWVLRRFAGQKKVAVSEIVELAKSDLNETIAPRAFYRILEELRGQGAIKQLEYGYYDFSNALNEQGGGK
jgi:DNA replicative helicase MCM subunit Mcm2 (Cdc46/Mcm family)